MRGYKRTYSRVPQSAFAAPCDHIHDWKRSKKSSPSLEQGAAVDDVRSATPKLMNVSIDDLPADVLAEILCRVGCYKSIAQCKCVSNRWGNLMSGLCFIGRFLCLQSDKQAPIKRSLLNTSGKEFLGRISAYTKPLSPLFEQLMDFHQLREEPVILGTYNDFVLCSASRLFQRDYYICNPSTIKWVPLPPPPQVHEFTYVGFICDLPYYNCRTDDQGGHVIQLNGDYRCRVVILICPDDPTTFSYEFKVQIFSSETSDWTETVVSSPSPFRFGFIDSRISYAINGMLYWTTHKDVPAFLIGLNPFAITSSSTTCSSGTHGDHYKSSSLIVLEQSVRCMLSTLGVYKGCMRVFKYECAARTLSVADLNDKEIMHEEAVSLCREIQHKIKTHSLDEDMIPDNGLCLVTILGFDPNDDDILYLKRVADRACGNRDIVECNIRTRKWSVIVVKTNISGYFFPLDLPWWPTPLPRVLGQHSHTPCQLLSFKAPIRSKK